MFLRSMLKTSLFLQPCWTIISYNAIIIIATNICSTNTPIHTRIMLFVTPKPINILFAILIILTIDFFRRNAIVIFRTTIIWWTLLRICAYCFVLSTYTIVTNITTRTRMFWTSFITDASTAVTITPFFAVYLIKCKVIEFHELLRM